MASCLRASISNGTPSSLTCRRTHGVPWGVAICAALLRGTGPRAAAAGQPEHKGSCTAASWCVRARCEWQHNNGAHNGMAAGGGGCGAPGGRRAIHPAPTSRSERTSTRRALPPLVSRIDAWEGLTCWILWGICGRAFWCECREVCTHVRCRRGCDACGPLAMSELHVCMWWQMSHAHARTTG